MSPTEHTKRSLMCSLKSSMARPDLQIHLFPFTPTHVTKQSRGIDLQSQEANPTDRTAKTPWSESDPGVQE